MKRKLLKERLQKLTGIITEQNVNSVPQIVDPFNYLVPYNFDNYPGPNLTAQAPNSDGWEIGTGGAQTGPAADCNAKTNIGLLTGPLGTNTAVSAGEGGSVFY